MNMFPVQKNKFINFKNNDMKQQLLFILLSFCSINVFAQQYHDEPKITDDNIIRGNTRSIYCSDIKINDDSKDEYAYIASIGAMKSDKEIYTLLFRVMGPYK